MGLSAQYGSSKVWRDFAGEETVIRPDRFVVFHDDFLGFNSASSAVQSWVETQASAGTAAVIDGFGGLLELDCNSSTADQGIQVQVATESFLPQAGTKLYFEARIASITDTPDKCQFFAGLSVLDTTLFNAGENSSANHIGFEMGATSLAASGGKLQFVAEKGGTRGTVADVHTVVDGAAFTIGFVVDGVSTVQCYVNGEPVGDPLPLANIPVTELTPTFACLTEGTNDPIVTVDWVRVVQTRPN
jgi:hypothetical protein